jgi:hypothetical protein
MEPSEGTEEVNTVDATNKGARGPLEEGCSTIC